MITRDCITAYRKYRNVLSGGESFLYLRPDPALNRWISNYTITFPEKINISAAYTVIPHGSATLVFSFDGSELCGTLFGPSTRPRAVGPQANSCAWLFIVEFQPAGLFAFTGITQSELTDQILPFDLLAPLLNRSLLDTIQSATSINDQITTLEHILLTHLTAAVPAELRSAADLIIKHSGNISSAALSNEVYYSTRHLNRCFNQHLGLTVKTFSRLVRINKSVRLLQDNRIGLAYISQLTGFYDESHFVHDFKTVCGITPLKYRSNMSDFYNEIAKF